MKYLVEGEKIVRERFSVEIEAESFYDAFDKTAKAGYEVSIEKINGEFVTCGIEAEWCDNNPIRDILDNKYSKARIELLKTFLSASPAVKEIYAEFSGEGDDGRIDVINVIPFGYDFFLDEDLIAGEGYSELVSAREVVMDISGHIIESLPVNWMDNRGGAGRIVIRLDNDKIKFDIMCHEWDTSEGLVFHKTLTCE